jgi:hypothetical protein
MVYLEYDMLGNHKKINIESIDHNNDNKVVKCNNEHYDYIVGAEGMWDWVLGVWWNIIGCSSTLRIYTLG